MGYQSNQYSGFSSSTALGCAPNDALLLIESLNQLRSSEQPERSKAPHRSGIVFMYDP